MIEEGEEGEEAGKRWVVLPKPKLFGVREEGGLRRGKAKREHSPWGRSSRIGGGCR